MKIRQGFVSNSSSSSFLIYGAALEEFEEKIELAKKLFPTLSKEQTRYVSDEAFEDIDRIDEDDAYEILGASLGMMGLVMESVYYEAFYVGRSWSTVGDEETGAQFKQDVEKKLEKLFGREVECSTLEQAWRDG